MRKTPPSILTKSLTKPASPDQMTEKRHEDAYYVRSAYYQLKDDGSVSHEKSEFVEIPYSDMLAEAASNDKPDDGIITKEGKPVFREGRYPLLQSG